MEANAGLVAGSHKKKQLVVIKQDVDNKPKPLQHASGQMCHICGDEIGLSAMGELFVACNECAFPVCRPCYEYERKDGNKVCPQCKTRYKRHKGSPRVEGDEEEDDVDDLENEFNYLDMEKWNKQQLAEAMLQGKMSYGGVDDGNVNQTMHPTSHVPLLTSSQHVSGEFPVISPEHHMPGSNGKRIHSGHYVDSNIPSSVESRSMDMSREFSPYEFGDIAWKERLEGWKVKQEKMQITTTEGGQAGGKGNDSDEQYGAGAQMTDEVKQPLSRLVPISPSKINPYRFIIIVRLVILAFFLKFRIENPVEDAYGLWLTSVICEIWFAVSWILDQFPKWVPVERETFLHRLALRFEPEGQPSKLASVDVYVSTVDPMKEPPLVTANTCLSILAVDYPVDKVSCYVSDDGAAMLTFETLSETSEFARKWVPFCKKFNIEPRAPEMYFAQKIDYLKDKIQPSFVKERRAMKREYEEFKVRINGLVAKAQKVPEDGWIMQDGTPWPGNNTRDHPGMIQVFLGHSGGHDTEGNELPKLVYVSREKRPGFTHHKKAGAMNALVRVSAVLTNAPFFLNLDCDHYINNSKALREAMCFLMDPVVGKNVCYVQFPQRFDGIDLHDRYANRNIVFFDINLKGLDGVQGPVYVGTGCFFRRQSLYGMEAPVVEDAQDQNFAVKCCCGPRRKRGSQKLRKLSKDKPIMRSESSLPMFNSDDIDEGVEGYEDDNRSLLTSQKSLEKRFGQSPVFIASTLREDGGIPESATPSSLLKEAIHVISCGYEDKSEWGKEIGWIYGSVTEDILTGFKMHSRGWRSIYCMPPRPAFKGSAPINLSDRLHQVLRWALGSVEILLSRHSPIWYAYGGRLKWLQRLAYINTTIYPLTSLPLIAYCSLPAICLLTNKFIIPPISNFSSLWFISLFISIFTTAILEMRWSGVGLDDWWRNEQFWVIGGVSAHLFAVFQGLLKVLAGIDTNFTVTSKSSDDVDFGELYTFKWTTLLIPPTTILIVNFIGIVAGVSDALNSGYQSWGPLFGKIFFSFWVVVHLYPFLKGFMGRQNRTPTIVIVWSILLASIFSLLWVKIDPFMAQTTVTTSNLQCGVSC